MLDAQTRSAPNFEWGPAPGCKIVKFPGFEGVRLVGPPQWGAHGLNGTRLTTTWEVFYHNGRYIPDTHNGREEPFSAILTPSKTITVHDFVLITGKNVQTDNFYLSYFDPCDGTYHFQFAVTHGSDYFKPPARRPEDGKDKDADVAGGGSSGGVGHPPDDSEENQRRQCSKPFIPGICRPFPEDRRQAPSEQELAGDEVILVAENISHDRRKYGFSTYIPQPEGEIPDYYLTQVIRQRLDGGSPESHVGGMVREKVCVQDGSIIQVDRIGNPSYHGLPDIHDPNATETSWSAQWNVKSYDDYPNQEPDTPGKMTASAILSEQHTTGKFKLDTFQNAWAHRDFFEKTAPHANLVLSKTEDSIQYTKTRYQVRIGADVALPFKTHVIEEFTPEHDPVSASTPAEKEYRIRNITITTGSKSATYSIDPQSEPDKEGTWRVFLLPFDMAVDSNRDGVIKFAGNFDSTQGKPYDRTEAAKPFRFWLNEDQDDKDTEETVPASSPDYADGQIKKVRDLEDFTRLNIYVGGLQEAIAQGNIKVGLKWKNTSGGSPSIKVWRNLSPNGGLEYLTNTSFAQQHLALTNPGHVQGSTPYIIPTQFWVDSGLSESQPNGYLLFEGCTKGKGQLVVTLHKADGTEIGEGPGVWLDLVNVRTMYRRVKATGIADNFEEPAQTTNGNPPEPTMGWVEDPNGNPYDESAPKSWEETKQYIVFVHGWNMSYEGSQNFAETMFKRLWQRGYKGRYAFMRWPTLDDSFAGIPYTYNASEYRAWKCGESLKQFVNSLPSGYVRNVTAHSMGNIVVGSALQKGVSLTNYALLNAAVPAACYDDSSTLDQGWGYTTPAMIPMPEREI